MEDGRDADFVPHSSLLSPLSSFVVPRLWFPRAGAGFMILAASMLPSALPAARVRNLLCVTEISREAVAVGRQLAACRQLSAVCSL